MDSTTSTGSGVGRGRSPAPGLSLIAIRVLTTALTLATLRLLAGRLPKSDYNVYIILIQEIGWIVAVGFLGMGVAVPTAVGKRGPKSAGLVLVSAAVVLVATLLIPLAALTWQADIVSQFIFREIGWGAATAGAAALVASLAPVLLVSYVLIGLSRYRTVMLIELMQSALIPLAIAVVVRGHLGIERFLHLYALGNACLAAAAAVALAIDRDSAVGPVWPSTEVARELVFVGTPKMLSGSFLLFAAAAFPVAVRWGGASLPATAAASFGLSVAISASRLAATPNALVTFMRLVRVPDPKMRSTLVEELRTLSLAGGAILVAFAAASMDLIVTVVFGRLYEAHAVFLALGGAVGALWFTITILEIPLDALEAPWRKARVSFACALALLVILTPIIAAESVSAMWIPAVFFVLLASFSASLYRLTRRHLDEKRFGVERASELLATLAAAGVGATVVAMSRALGGSIPIRSTLLIAAGLIVLGFAYRSGLFDSLLARMHSLDDPDLVL